MNSSEFTSYLENYADWKIVILPTSMTGYSIRCFPPGSDEAFQPEAVYSSEKKAMEAAKCLIQRRKARESIGEILTSMRKTNRLSADEYAELLTLLAASF